MWQAWVWRLFTNICRYNTAIKNPLEQAHSRGKYYITSLLCASLRAAYFQRKPPSFPDVSCYFRLCTNPDCKKATNQTALTPQNWSLTVCRPQHFIERIRAGLAAARERGRIVGRRRIMTRAIINRAEDMLIAGATRKQVADVIGVDVKTIYRYLPASE